MQFVGKRLSKNHQEVHLMKAEKIGMNLVEEFCNYIQLAGYYTKTVRWCFSTIVDLSFTLKWVFLAT